MSLPGCAGNDTQKLIKQLQPVASWLAAIDFAAESWTDNRIPTAYLEKTIQEASGNLNKTRTSVDKIQDAPADLHSAATTLLARSSVTLTALQRAVSISDLRMTRARADQLKSLSDTLEAIVDQLEAHE